MPEIKTVSPIVLIIFIVLLVIYYYVFEKNPYHVLNYARIPIMVACLVTLFCVLIFIEYYSNQPSYISTEVNELWPNFLKYAYKYFYYLFYIFAIALLSYGAFVSIKSGVIYSFQYSFWVTVGLLFLVLALFSNSSKDTTFNSSYLDLIKTIIMYIPCLITDFIDYMKKDYENTPSTVFIVFVLILFYILIFFMIPLFRQQQYKNDGVLLVEKASYLNTDVLSITSDELKEKILKQRPFYDRWFQKLLAMESKPKDPEKTSETDIREEEKKALNFIVPPDSLTLPYYLKKLEGFNTLQVEDSQLIPFHLFKSRMKKENESTDEELEPFKERNLMKEFIQAHPELLTVIEKLQYIYSAVFSSRDTLLAFPSIIASEDSKIKKFDYNYAITSWVYLQEAQSNDIQRIYSFGNRPSLYYDPLESSLMVIINYGTNRQKTLYKTTKQLFQRWNFIVMNYKNGTLDLFINNNLVGTYPNAVSTLNSEDILLVGSKENQRIGGICNMKYYELALGVRKIDTIYKSFHNKKIPI
jgi:hypothetical protein